MSSVPHRKDIQGLRAIAVLAVMVFHLNPTWLPGGFVGVDVFLVISGFLITSILLHKKSSAGYSLTETLKYFYVSRFKRIVPAYFLMLIIVALVAAVLFLPSDFNTFRKGLEKATWFSSNRYFADFGDYFAPASNEQPLLHTWSLAVEIQFYLLAPFIVLLLPIRLLKWFFVVLLIGLTALAEYHLRFLGMEQATYYSLYARLPEFFVGGLAALYVTTVSRVEGSTAWLGILGMLLIVISAITQPLLGSFPGILALLPVVGSVLLLSQPTQGWVGELLSCKTLVWLGGLSYSLYLWHWPVLAFLRYYTSAEVLDIEFSILFVLLTFILSIVSYYGVERVFRSKSTKKKQALSWGLLVFGVLGASQTMAKVNAMFTPVALPLEYLRYGDDSQNCHGHIVGDCLRGDLDSVKEILVLGDSHAAMLNHFFDHIGKEIGFKARVITASSCVTIPGFDYNRIAEWAQQSCVAQIEQTKSYLENVELIFITASWNWHLRSEEFNRALRDFLQNMASQAQVYILSQVPLLNRNPQRAKRFLSLGLTPYVNINSDYLRTNEYLYDLSMVIDRVHYLELNFLPVFKSPPFYNGELLYYDEHHLNEVAVVEYAKQALPTFEEIFIEWNIVE
ncbi:acyltransferase [Vibrio cholerae]|uniref:acyltransferase family protein n=1 Tax=Vibrio cholerae TaxID=666 RepID=UPI001E5EB84D|nr:acyltransferase [Vibrio cholerae]MCD9211684.1 acyltransferase [Vibrio cholerae]MCU4221738.1 acyltransferase [Vibrio cholerae]HCZ9577162.1 acyltransferase [Vibrio cholerae]HCZ9602183.1 acyltransferase [Vibrio cholerae]